MTILVKLDEEEIRRAIQAYLLEQGFKVLGPPQLIHNPSGAPGGGESFEARAEVIPAAES
jgi:hypothetical protein